MDRAWDKAEATCQASLLGQDFQGWGYDRPVVERPEVEGERQQVAPVCLAAQEDIFQLLDVSCFKCVCKGVKSFGDERGAVYVG